MRAASPSSALALALLLLLSCTAEEVTGPPGTRMLYMRLNYVSWYADEEYRLEVDGEPVPDADRPGQPWQWDGGGTAGVPLSLGVRSVRLVPVYGACRVGEGRDTRALPLGKPALLEFDIACGTPLGASTHLAWTESTDGRGPESRLTVARPSGESSARAFSDLFVTELLHKPEGAFVGIGGSFEYAWDEYFGYGAWWMSGRGIVELNPLQEPHFLMPGEGVGGLQRLPGHRYGFQVDTAMVTLSPDRPDDLEVACVLPVQSSLSSPRGAWSPDGNRIAVENGTRVAIYTVGPPMQLVATYLVNGLAAARPEWKPDGGAVASIVQRGTRWSVIALGLDGRLLWEAELPGIEPEDGLRWLPDGSGLVVGGSVTGDANAGLFLVRTGGELRRLTLRARPPTAWAVWDEP